MGTRIVIAGGGTGGHLFPGIALARSLLRHEPDMEIMFIGTKQGIETKVLPRENLPLRTIQASGLIGKRGWKRWLSWLKLPAGLLQSFYFLLSRRPQLVVGVGGYSSGPVALAAACLRIPVLIHEQNAFPGVTNRWLGKVADKVAISFQEAARFFPAHKAVLTGNMIREEFCAVERMARAASGPAARDILVFGGSQGAHSINAAMLAALDHLPAWRGSLRISHQTGGKEADSVRAEYAAKGFTAEVQPFFYDMAGRYRQAFLVICRAGATTLAEITACGKAAVLIPFPHAAHNHQEHNARVLEAAGAAVVIPDCELTGERLAAVITRFLENPALAQAMEENSFRLGCRDAAEQVARLCLGLIGQAA